MLKEDAIVAGVAQQIVWWIGNRRKKLEEMSHESMAINPFLVPIIYALEGISSPDELAKVLLSGHFATGHATGFGKLIDEKILPNVFGTQKLNRAFRSTKPWSSHLFDEVDHVATVDGDEYLLSQKASRWTIQLTMAVQLNSAFSQILALRKEGQIKFKGIVVGVFYGTNEGLTDKYDIIRGINRGAKHDVVDIKNDVQVLAGRKFWIWLNGGVDQTQEWVTQGILVGLEQANKKYGPTSDLVKAYTAAFSEKLSQHVVDGKIDWKALLKAING